MSVITDGIFVNAIAPSGKINFLRQIAIIFRKMLHFKRHFKNASLSRTRNVIGDARDFHSSFFSTSSCSLLQRDEDHFSWFTMLLNIVNGCRSSRSAIREYNSFPRSSRWTSKEIATNAEKPRGFSPCRALPQT